MSSNDGVMNNDDHVEYYYDVECNLVNRGKFLIVKADRYLINSNYSNYNIIIINNI